MRKNVKIYQHHTGYWVIFDFDEKKILYSCDNELEAYRTALNRDYKLIY
jgi:hypothetical protein